MITSYMNAINRHDYQRAYGYWRNPSQSFDAFKQGYANTRTVVASLRPASGIDAAAGQRRMLIATVLQTTLSTGGQQEFAGCYVAWRAAQGVSSNPSDSLWHIEEATVKQVQGGQLSDLLDQACESYKDRVSAYGAAYDDKSGALNVVLSLYDAINRKDYQRAYGYWEQAPQSYSQFVAGYANTKSVAVTVGSPTDTGAAAGSIYTRVPVIVTATDTDGSVHAFSGCYQGRRSNIPPEGKTDPTSNPWSIYSGTLSEVNGQASPAELIAAGCTQ